jgi:hypothetical protein
MPASAQTVPNSCEVVRAYGGVEVRDDLPAGLYYLYVLTDDGFQAHRLGYSNGSIRFLLGDLHGNQVPDAFLIVTPEGQIVSAC